MAMTRKEIQAETNRLKNEYGSLFDSIATVLFENDPMGINFETNTDEYYPEVRTILPRLRKCNSIENTMLVVYEEFQNWFGEDVGSKEDYRQISEEIFSLWQKYIEK